MSYSVKPGSSFGRLGQGIGQGLSEQLPKEIERYRLASGLKQFEQDVGNLNPIQQLARLSSIPGITPQMIQSFGELARHQNKAKALSETQASQNEPKPFPMIPQSEQKSVGGEQKIPTTTTRKPIEATVEPYIPKTYEQILQRGSQLYNQNPALFGNNPDAAIQAATQEDAQNQSINSALQSQRSGQQNVEGTIKNYLQKENDRLGSHVPGRVYSKIENKAINAVLPKEEGGEGLTEQEASKKYGKELDTASRDYNSIPGLGNWLTLPLGGRSSKSIKQNIDSLRKKFKERGELEDFADEMIGENGFSPQMAYSLAYPINDDIKSEINKLKTHFIAMPETINQETRKISERLAPLLKNSDESPLAIAQELMNKGYNVDMWMQYLNDHSRELDLKESQLRQLDKPRSQIPKLSDLWLRVGGLFE